MSFLPFVAYATMKWPYQPATRDGEKPKGCNNEMINRVINLKCCSARKPPGSGMELYNTKIGEIDLDSIPPCFKSSSSKRELFYGLPTFVLSFQWIGQEVNIRF